VNSTAWDFSCEGASHGAWCIVAPPAEAHCKKYRLLLQEILLIECRMQVSLKPEMKLLTAGPGQHPL